MEDGLSEFEEGIIRELSEKFEVEELDAETFERRFKEVSKELNVETLDEVELRKLLKTTKVEKGEVTKEEMEWEIKALPVPESIKEELLSKLQGIKLDRRVFKRILEKVVEKYEAAKVEPCEAVGIVAAQSIGEPGTQMSLPYDEKIVIKEGEEIKPVEIGAFVDESISKYGCFTLDGGKTAVCELPPGVDVFVPSLDEDGKIRWKRVLACIRHRAPEKLLRVRTKSNREITATSYHSFVIKKGDRITPVRGSELKVGDRIPVVKFLPVSCLDTLALGGCEVELDYELGRTFGAGAAVAAAAVAAAAPRAHGGSDELAAAVDEIINGGRLPDFVYGASEEFVRGLLRGYFDANAEVGDDGIAVRVRTRELANGLALLLTRFGIFTTKKKDGSQYVLTIPRSYVAEFAEKIRPMTRKMELEALLTAAAESGDADDVIWDEIVEINEVECHDDYVYDVSVEGLETFMTFEGVITHNTMRTFHYAGVGAIYVTLGLPRIIEIVDARKTPSTPVMKVYLEGEYAYDRSKAESIAMEIEETRLSHIAEIKADVSRMVVVVKLKDEMLKKRGVSVDEIIKKVENGISKKGLELEVIEKENTLLVYLGEESYRKLLRLEEELSNMLIKGIEGIKRVVIRADEKSGEYVLYTEGSALKKVMQIEGVDYRRTTTNNIHEIAEVLGIEAARNAIIEEMMSTLEEQGLNVDVRHIMLVADMMTVDGEIKQIGRHGVAGEKASVLSRAAFEVTVNHLLDAAMYGYVDELRGVTENVIVGQPIRLGTGDVELVAKRFDQLVKELKKAKA